jgi:N-acylglucosamine 2-epimerase (GlcNAc 2-epimerase).
MRVRSPVALSLGLLLLCGGWSSAPAQPADSLLQGRFWTTQGRAILSAWTRHAQAGDGTLYAELDRTWTPTDSSTQYPGMLARHLYSYAAGYLLTGREAYLNDADAILDFLVEHGWDGTHGGWTGDTSATLHYRLDSPDVNTLRPLPIKDRPRIERMRINGTEQTPPDAMAGPFASPRR